MGKTIEAGLIVRELLMRQRVCRIVVAAPPSAVLQWQEELDTRFGLTFVVLDREYVRRMRQERGYGVNSWATHSRFIVSPRLPPDEDYASPRRDWLGTFAPASLRIVDEAHNNAPACGARYAIDSQFTKGTCTTAVATYAESAPNSKRRRSRTSGRRRLSCPTWSAWRSRRNGRPAGGLARAGAHQRLFCHAPPAQPIPPGAARVEAVASARALLCRHSGHDCVGLHHGIGLDSAQVAPRVAALERRRGVSRFEFAGGYV